MSPTTMKTAANLSSPAEGLVTTTQPSSTLKSATDQALKKVKDTQRPVTMSLQEKTKLKLKGSNTLPVNPRMPIDIGVSQKLLGYS